MTGKIEIISEVLDTVTLDAAYDPAAIVMGHLARLRSKLETHLVAQVDDVVRTGLPRIQLIVSQQVTPRTPS